MYITVMHVITANISVLSSSTLRSSLKYFPGPSTDSRFALILSGKSDGRFINSLTSAFEVTALNLKIDLLTCSVFDEISAGKISVQELEVWQSNVHPRRLDVGTVYAGIFIAISQVNQSEYSYIQSIRRLINKSCN